MSIPVTQRSTALVTAMSLSIMACYTNTLPLAVRLVGLVVFFACAVIRPDLAILFIPLTIPLYLIPASFEGLRDRAILLPLHEVVLGLVGLATGTRWAWHAYGKRQIELHWPEMREALPIILFLLAGVWGTLIALPEARPEALRELRWLVLEPLIFYLLLRTTPSAKIQRAIMALIVAGSCVALIGILQYIGIDIVPLIGEKRSFSENIVEAGNARRVASVYGHPNNLGLFLGRVWPIAVALAIGQYLRKQPISNRRTPAQAAPGYWLATIGYWLAAIVCLAGLVVSFSRGAWLGAAVAVLVLTLCGIGSTHRLALPLIGLAIGGASLAMFVLTARGAGGSEATRLLLWQEALGYLQQHPLGIGLDQFYAYHNPESGRSLINPKLVGTSEQYAAHPHNVVLDIWLRMGPLGLLAIGWLIVRFVRESWQLADLRAMPLVVGTLAAMAAALTHGLVDQFYFVPDLALVFWLFVAASGDATRQSNAAIAAL